MTCKELHHVYLKVAMDDAILLPIDSPSHSA